MDLFSNKISSASVLQEDVYKGGREEASEEPVSSGARSCVDAPALRLKAVSHSFGSTEVLKSVSLEVPNGQKLALIGASGSGKTTLLRLIAGSIKPTHGQVETLGHETSLLHGAELRDLRQRLGFLYQNDNLIPGLRVVHNVLMGRLAHWGFLKALFSLLFPRELDSVRQVLREVELEEKLWASTQTLSGGQQQRVAIARLMIQRPDLILADEPVSSLDVRLGQEVVNLLSRLANETKSTLVVSLHTLDLLRSNFERVLALKDGRVFWDGPPQNLTREMLSDLYGAEASALHLNELFQDS